MYKRILGKPYHIINKVIVKGASGVLHKFDILASWRNEEVYIDFVYEVKDTDIIRFIAKKLDTNVKRYLIVTLNISEDEVKMLKDNGIEVLNIKPP